jgi:dihydrofolate reductase
MQKMLKLYIAISIDGYIADENGSVDWLHEIENPNNIDHGYYDFYDSIDTVVMGRKTYADILSFDVDWPYSDSKCYVFSKNNNLEISTPDTELINDLSIDSINMIRANTKKNIWIVGGGKLITEFLKYKQIDEIIISIIPVLLGSGTRLFNKFYEKQNLTLQNVESFDTGIVNLSYVKK